MKHLTKDNLYLKFLRYFYKIEGDLDEYILGEINRFGNHAFMVAYTSFLAIGIFWFFTGIGLYDWFIFGFAFLPPIFLHRLIKTLGLDRVEIEHQHLKTAHRMLWRRTLLQTLFFAIFWGLIIGGAAYTKQFDYHPEFPVIAFWSWVIITSIFFIGSFFKNRKKVRLID